MQFNRMNSASLLSSAGQWGTDLDPAGQRRLWLILKVIEAGHPVTDAFEAAQKVEKFLTSNGAAPPVLADPEPGATPAWPPYRSSSRRPLLDAATKERFAVEAARNDDNRHLAKTFNLTVRQAHAVRLSQSRRIEEIRTHPPRAFTIVASPD
jgi:hypothetical protein